MTMKITWKILLLAALSWVLFYGALWGGMWAFNAVSKAYEERAPEYKLKRETISRFETAQQILTDAVFNWSGDTHTKEEEEKFHQIIMDAYYAGDQYELWVRGQADGYLLDTYQWTLVAMKNALYNKAWKETGNLLIAMMFMSWYNYMGPPNYK